LPAASSRASTLGSSSSQVHTFTRIRRPHNRIQPGTKEFVTARTRISFLCRTACSTLRMWQEQCRVRALDGTTSLIRSFPSKVSVSVPCASNPPAHIHTLACRVSQGTHTNTQPVPAKRGRSQDERGWYSCIATWINSSGSSSKLTRVKLRIWLLSGIFFAPP
jgi:hypothetical protein